MAFDKEKEFKNTLKRIEDNHVCFFGDIELYGGPTKSTLCKWKFHESDDIKELLAKNRAKKKKKMRDKWEDSENATLQLAAYKLMADDEELDRLTTNTNKNQHSGEVALNPVTIYIPDNGRDSTKTTGGLSGESSL